MYSKNGEEQWVKGANTVSPVVVKLRDRNAGDHVVMVSS